MEKRGISRRIKVNEMSEIRGIQADAFEEEVKQADKPVALFFWMRSCDGCRKFKPVFQQLPDKIPQMKFIQMNSMKSVENLRLSESLGAEVTPTVKIFCRGEVVGTLVGHRPLEKAVSEINEFLTSNNCI